MSKINLDSLLSQNASHMRPSPARSILSGLNIEELISFGGGYPNPDTFPVDDLKRIVDRLLRESPSISLQYGPTEGDPNLREELAKRYYSQGVDITKEDIAITTSSQQAIDLCSKIFINRGDTVVCSLPSYFGALQSFWFWGGVPVGVADENSLESTIIKLIEEDRKPKFIYSIPDFQNPSGITLTLAQRENIIRVAQLYDLIIIEDSPYRELRYSGDDLPTLLSMDRERVILLGTFSKTLTPGFRLGWVVANPSILSRIVVAKQSTDLCASVFDQAIAARYLRDGLFESNLVKTIELYRGKRELMLECFKRYMPKCVSWTVPEGGLFLFVTLPVRYNATDVLKLTLIEDLAFIPGEIFFCNGEGKNTMRINFSYAQNEKIEKGVKILASAINRVVSTTHIPL
ncbi:MAG: aminotransferase [Bacteroidetes bacterium HGW-Bacteroidetes-8]|nr:MAG: aminotransferase [Bacteroidetes bacterium HGW-Bacteroidetes-8]